MVAFEINYDEEFDDLYLYRSDKKSDISITLGDFVTDYQENTGLFIGVQITHASTTLSEWLQTPVTKEKLQEMKNVEVHIYPKGNVLYISMLMKSDEQEDDMLKIPLMIPSI